MKALICFFVLLGVNIVSLAEGQPVVFYTQLIRGTDQDQPRQSDWQPVGPKLRNQLCPKFRWKNYWEVDRQTVQVSAGKPTRVRLSQEREIEIEMRTKDELEIRLYTAGKLVRRSRQAVESKMTIMGGGWEKAESWFIVVRRDKPSVE